MIEIIALSLIQGITEFLPISSSSHLIIISEYLEFNKRNLEIDVSLHIGSFLAVIVFFRKDIFNFVQYKKVSFAFASLIFFALSMILLLHTIIVSLPTTTFFLYAFKPQLKS